MEELRDNKLSMAGHDLARKGREEIHPDERDWMLDDGMLLKACQDDGLSGFSEQNLYWLKRYVEAGHSLNRKREAEQAKMMSKPATVGGVHTMIMGAIYGKAGLRDQLNDMINTTSGYLYYLSEALKEKGIITEAEIETTRKRLVAEHSAEIARQRDEITKKAEEEAANAAQK